MKTENSITYNNNNKFNLGFLSCLLFSVSFVHPMTIIVFLIYLIYLIYKQKEIGGIKALNLITLREIINPGIAVRFGSLQAIKWIFIFAISFYLIWSVFKLGRIELSFLKKYYVFFFIYIIYSIISSFIFSNLPIVAIFKVVSYFVPFTGLLICVIFTIKDFDWAEWLKNVFTVIVVISTPLIFLPVGYLRNFISFQGLINHPNLFGVFLVLYVALCFVDIQKRIVLKKNNALNYLMVFLSGLMILLTNSRTSLGTVLFISALFILLSNYKLLKKALFFSISSVILALSLPHMNFIKEFLQEFFLKGGENIFDSRANQLGSLMEAFNSNPLFGRGFAVPYIPQRTYTFSFAYVVEPGNLVLAVLAYGGIIGFALFALFLFKTFLMNKNNFRTDIYLPIAAILICMGEMVFFSTNNIGIFVYMFLIIYVSKGIYNKNKLKQLTDEREMP